MTDVTDIFQLFKQSIILHLPPTNLSRCC